MKDLDTADACKHILIKSQARQGSAGSYSRASVQRSTLVVWSNSWAVSVACASQCLCGCRIGTGRLVERLHIHTRQLRAIMQAACMPHLTTATATWRPSGTCTVVYFVDLHKRSSSLQHILGDSIHALLLQALRVQDLVARPSRGLNSGGVKHRRVKRQSQSREDCTIDPGHVQGNLPRRYLGSSGHGRSRRCQQGNRRQHRSQEAAEKLLRIRVDLAEALARLHHRCEAAFWAQEACTCAQAGSRFLSNLQATPDSA